MKNICFLSLAVILLLTTANPVQAQDSDFISVGVGYYDILDNEGAADFRVEYRPNIPILVEDFRPWLGAEVTSDGSVWGGGGFLYDWEFSPSWYIVPSVGVGAYAQGSSDLDLGHTVEFRSQLELAHEFETGQRAGVAFGHLSNASLDDQNPGTEVLNLYWHMPY